MAFLFLPWLAFNQVHAGTAPSITTPPVSQVATTGTRAVFTVEATGDAPLHYLWKQDGVPIGSDAATLSLDAVTATDQGEYSVTVTNASGSTASLPAFLYTEPPVPAFFQDNLAALSAGPLASRSWTEVKIPGHREQVCAAQLNAVDRVWTNIAPGFANVIYDMKIDDGTITAILDLGGLIQSADGGKSWKPISYKLPGNGVYGSFFSFDISPADPQLIIVAGSYLARTTSGGKWWMEIREEALPPIFLADKAGSIPGHRTFFGRVRFNCDGSRVFTALGAPGHDLKPRFGVEDEMRDMFNRKRIYVGNAQGTAFKAYDLGAFAGIRSICAHPKNPDRVYFSFGDGDLFVTRNATETTPHFQKLDMPSGYEAVNIDVSPWDDGLLLLVLKPLADGLPQKIVLARDNGGTSLTCSDVPLVSSSGASLTPSAPYTARWNPRVKDQVFVGINGVAFLLKSDDAMKSFVKVPFPSSLVHGLSGFYTSPQWVTFDTKTSLMAAWSCIGGWYSDDQFATWKDLLMSHDDSTRLFGNKGVGYAECTVSLFNLKNAAYMATNDHGLFRSNGPDHTRWECISANPGMPVKENGSAWASLFFPMGVSPDERFIYAFARGAYPNNPYSNDQLKLVKSTDQGRSWADVTPLLGLGDVLTRDQTPKEFLFNADASVQLILFNQSLYVSRDSGKTFAAASVPLAAGGQEFGFGFTGLAFDPVHNIFYAASNTGLARSTDSGASWQVIASIYVPGIGVNAKGDLILGCNGQLFLIPHDQIEALISENKISSYYLKPYVKATIGDTVDEVTSSQNLFNRIVTSGDTILVNVSYGAYQGNRLCGTGPLVSKDGGKTFQWAAYNLPVTGYFSAGIGKDDILLGCGGGAYRWETPRQDTTMPTTPKNLAGTAVSATRIDLTWNASADDVGIARYGVHRDGNLVGTTTTCTYADTGLNPATTYAYSITAYDDAGNASPGSSSLNVVTKSLAVPGGTGGGAGSSGGGGAPGLGYLAAILLAAVCRGIRRAL